VIATRRFVVTVAMANNYYWRAVRRLAERLGITIRKARTLDWEKEANAERKRRSKAARKPKVRKPATRTTTPRKAVRTPISRVRPKRSGSVPRRISKPVSRKTVSSARSKPELKIKDYGRMRSMDEEDYEDDIEFTEQWETDWEQDYPDLDYLGDLIDFVDDFEHEDSDKYKEPS
jgi:hypothetical protein